MDGKRWARLTLWVGIIMSMYGNIQHTLIIQKHPHWGALLFSGFWPGAVFLAIELMAKVEWPEGWSWSAARFGGLGIVAAVAAVASYHHLSALLTYWGEDSTVAALGPLVPDGIMVIATTALLAIGRPEIDADALEDPGEGDDMPEPAAPSSEPSGVTSPNGHRRPRKRQVATRDGQAERKTQAVDRYRDSVASGQPLSGDELGKLFGMSGRWGRDRIAEAKS